MCRAWEAQEGEWGLEDPVVPLFPFHYRSPKDVGDVIALSDITPSGAADHSQEPSPVGSRRGRLTPNLSRASSDADHVVSRRVQDRGGCRLGGTKEGADWEGQRKDGRIKRRVKEGTDGGGKMVEEDRADRGRETNGKVRSRRGERGGWMMKQETDRWTGRQGSLWSRHPRQPWLELRGALIWVSPGPLSSA